MGKRKCSDCGTVFSDSRSSCPKCYSESYEDYSASSTKMYRQQSMYGQPDMYGRSAPYQGRPSQGGSEIVPKRTAILIIIVAAVLIVIFGLAQNGVFSNPEKVALSTAKEAIETTNKQRSSGAAQAKIGEPKVLSNTGNVYYIYAEETGTILGNTYKGGLIIVVRVNKNKGEILYSGMSGDDKDKTLEFYKMLYDSYAN